MGTIAGEWSTTDKKPLIVQNVDPYAASSGIYHGESHHVRVYDNMLQLLSDADNPTPLVRLQHVTKHLKHAKVYAKLEWYNPFGSIKDRVAANLVNHGEQVGHLTPGTKMVEATSGNTGLGLVMVANAKGYPLTVPISTRVPAEKRNALKFMGADLIELDDEL
jgi:cysteine synthase